MKTKVALLLQLGILALTSLRVGAQNPDTLHHFIASPVVGAQPSGQLGFTVGVVGGWTLAAVPNYDDQTIDCGVVKVFDSTSGALVMQIPNPLPSSGDHFGEAMAVSGTRVVVGIWGEDIGANEDGRAYVFDLSSGTPTVPVLTLNNPAPANLDNFGWAVAISGTRVVVSAYLDDAGATNSGSVYVYDLTSGTPTVPVYTLTNPSPAVSDQFGYAVAISGTRVLVGANQDDTGATDAGSVYVYDLSSGTPTTPVLTLQKPGTVVDDEFGSAVVINGDQVVVGVRLDDTGASNAGSAYVYDLSSGTPTVPVHTLNNPTPDVADQFGHAVALEGSRVAVGAYTDDTGELSTGIAYVYDLSSGTPTVPAHTLTNPSPGNGDRFGNAVALVGQRLVVGAYQDDMGAADAGSAYVYELGSGTPTVPVATLNHPGPTVIDEFGYSVAISGTRVVVGARQDDTGATDAGSVYVYDLTSSTPKVPVFTLNNPSPAATDQFGSSVAIAGTRVVVGVNGDDTGASNAGSAYVYDLGSGTPTVPILTLNNPGPAAADSFGFSVGISGTSVVVGAYQDDTGAGNAGSAYVYDLTSGTPTVPVHTLNNPSPAVSDNFGWSVGISGTRVVVGSPQDDDGASNAGTAYIYDLNSGTPTVPVHTLSNPSPAVGDTFGFSVAISGLRVVAGTPDDDTGASAAGIAYVYDLSSGTPTVPVATLNNPGPAPLDAFGRAVALSGSRVVVGAYSDDAGASDAGSVHVYDMSSATPAVPVAILNNPSPANSDWFGYFVAIDGATVVVGIPNDDTVILNKGAAYIYGPMDGDSDGLRDPWEITHFGTQYGHGPLDDDDHDGYVSLLELGLGLNPTLTNLGGIPGVAEEGGYLTMTITKQPGVTYEVQTAGTLVPAQPDSFSAASTTVLINNATTLKARDNFLISSGARRFIRVQVTATP